MKKSIIGCGTGLCGQALLNRGVEDLNGIDFSRLVINRQLKALNVHGLFQSIHFCLQICVLCWRRSLSMFYKELLRQTQGDYEGVEHYLFKVWAVVLFAMVPNLGKSRATAQTTKKK